MMSDMSRCPHGDAVGYCDICSPGWEMELIKADAQNKIFSRGIELGRKELEQQLSAERAAHEETKRENERLHNQNSVLLERKIEAEKNESAAFKELQSQRQRADDLVYRTASFQERAETAEAKLYERDAQIAKSRGQKPVAWVIGPADCDMKGWIPCKAYEEGEFTKPLYLSHIIPPSTSELIEQARREENEACANAAASCEVDLTSRWILAVACEAIRERMK